MANLNNRLGNQTKPDLEGKAFGEKIYTIKKLINNK